MRGIFNGSVMLLVIVFSVFGEDTIRGYFVGDCTIGSEVNNKTFDRYVDSLGTKYFMGGVREVLRRGDFVVGNLETTIGELGSPREKRFRFRGKAGYLDILKDGGIGIVSISNNHIYDYGEEGYEETCKKLDSAGISYYGFGKIKREMIKCKRFIFIGVTGFREDTTLYDRIREERGDYVVVSVHWGEESNYGVTEMQRRIGQRMIESGADLVVGHHPHVIEPIERYRGGYIVYSLGNFCFGGNRNPRDKDSYILGVDFSGGVVKGVKIIPVSISSSTDRNDYRPRVLEDTVSILRIYRKLGHAGGIIY